MSIEKGLQIYEEMRRQGRSKKVAKVAAYQAYPAESKKWKQVGTPEATMWANGVKECEKSLGVDETKSQPPLALEEAVEVAEGGKYQPVSDILRYLTLVDPDIGTEMVFNLHYEQVKYGKENDSAWRQSFLYPEKNRVGRLGWRFEVLNKAGKEFRVKVLSKPQATEPLGELKRLEQLEREIAEIKARWSNTNGKQ